MAEDEASAGDDLDDVVEDVPSATHHAILDDWTTAAELEELGGLESDEADDGHEGPGDLPLMDFSDAESDDTWSDEVDAEATTFGSEADDDAFQVDGSSWQGGSDDDVDSDPGLDTDDW